MKHVYLNFLIQNKMKHGHLSHVLDDTSKKTWIEPVDNWSIHKGNDNLPELVVTLYCS